MNFANEGDVFLFSCQKKEEDKKNKKKTTKKPTKTVCVWGGGVGVEYHFQFLSSTSIKHEAKSKSTQKQ